MSFTHIILPPLVFFMFIIFFNFFLLPIFRSYSKSINFQKIDERNPIHIFTIVILPGLLYIIFDEVFLYNKFFALYFSLYLTYILFYVFQGVVFTVSFKFFSFIYTFLPFVTLLYFTNLLDSGFPPMLKEVFMETSNYLRVKQPEIIQPEIIQLEIIQPEIIELEIIQPEIIELEIIQPEIKNPPIANSIPLHRKYLKSKINPYSDLLFTIIIVTVFIMVVL